MYIKPYYLKKVYLRTEVIWVEKKAVQQVVWRVIFAIVVSLYSRQEIAIAKNKKGPAGRSHAMVEMFLPVSKQFIILYS